MALLIERKEVRGWAGEIDLYATREPCSGVALNRCAVANLNEGVKDETG